MSKKPAPRRNGFFYPKYKNFPSRKSLGVDDVVYGGRSWLCCLRIDNPFRRWCINLVERPMFDHFILVMIILNCVVLAFDNPLKTSSAHENTLFAFELFFTIIFSCEMMIKITSYGFVFNARFSYLRDAWNVLDFLVVTLAIVGMFMESNLSAMRAFRLLRPLRTLSRFPGLKVLAEAMIQAFRTIASVALLIMFFFFLYGLAGLQLFNGRLAHRCFYQNIEPPVWDRTREELCRMYANGTEPDTEVFQCPAGQYCGDSGVLPNGIAGFDNILTSWLSVLTSASMEGWSSLMYRTFESTTYASALYFVLLVLTLGFFITHLVAAVVFEAFQSVEHKEQLNLQRKDEVLRELEKVAQNQNDDKKKAALAAARKAGAGGGLMHLPRRATIRTMFEGGKTEEENLAENLELKVYARNRRDESGGGAADHHYNDDDDSLMPPVKEGSLMSSFGTKKSAAGLPDSRPPYVPSTPFGKTCRWLVQHPRFKITIVILIALNTLFLASKHHNQSDDWSDLLRAVNWMFTGLFTLEVILKLVGLRFSDEWLGDYFNVFDALIVVLSIIEIIIVESAGIDAAGLTAFRSVRLLRLFNMMRDMKELRRLISILVESTWYAINAFMLFMLFAFIFALMGVQLFAGKMKVNGTGPLPRAHFDSLGWALVTVFQVLGGSQWDQVMYDAVDSTDWSAAIFFIFCFVLGSYILYNLFLSIVLLAFKHMVPSELPETSEEDDEDDDSSQAYNVVEVQANKSLFCLGPDSAVRLVSAGILSNAIFEACIIIMILVSTIVQAFEVPGFDHGTFLGKFIYITNWLAAILFAVEALLKIIALGFVMHKGSYLRDGWNRLDFFIVIVAIVDLALAGSNAGFVKSIRTVRCLRPLRMVSHFETLQVVVGVVLESIYSVLNVLLLNTMLYIVFGIMAINLFAGQFARCQDPDENTIPVDRVDCENRRGHLWQNPTAGNFDNIFSALFTLFEISQMERWPDLMHIAVDVSTTSTAPIRDNHKSFALFFVVFVFLSKYYVANLYVGVIVRRFADKMKPIAQERPPLGHRSNGKSWLDDPDFEEPVNECRQLLFWIVNHTVFEYFIYVCVVVNIVFMSFWHHGQPDWLESLLDTVNLIFLIIFLLELTLKLAALGGQYFHSKWNWLDFTLIILGFVATIGSWKFDPTIFRVFRLVRLLRVFTGLRRLRTLMETVIRALPGLFSSLVIIFIFYFIYAVSGMSLFGNLPYRNEITRHANFNTFSLALLTLFRMTTGENWNGILHDCTRMADSFCETQDFPLGGVDRNCGTYLAHIYFFSFIMLTRYLLVNLLIAVVLFEFEVQSQKEKEERYKALQRRNELLRLHEERSKADDMMKGGSLQLLLQRAGSGGMVTALPPRDEALLPAVVHANSGREEKKAEVIEMINLIVEGDEDEAEDGADSKSSSLDAR